MEFVLRGSDALPPRGLNLARMSLGRGDKEFFLQSAGIQEKAADIFGGRPVAYQPDLNAGEVRLAKCFPTVEEFVEHGAGRTWRHLHDRGAGILRLLIDMKFYLGVFGNCLSIGVKRNVVGRTGTGVLNETMGVDAGWI